MKVLCGVVLFVTALVSSIRGGPVGSLRIINGTEISIEKVPYQVYVDTGCGGSILTRRHIATAAHCSMRRSIEFIRAGSSNKAKGGQLINVVEQINHPKYVLDNIQTYYDFALLVLAEDLVFNENVQRIGLAREPVPDGTMFLTSGWGITHNSSMDPNMLRAVEVPQMNLGECQKMYRENALKPNVDESMVCAGYEREKNSICDGDSGGPLAFNKTLYGISSWVGRPCGGFRSPSVFANVPEAYDWYMSLIKDFL